MPVGTMTLTSFFVSAGATNWPIKNRQKGSDRITPPMRQMSMTAEKTLIGLFVTSSVFIAGYSAWILCNGPFRISVARSSW